MVSLRLARVCVVTVGVSIAMSVAVAVRADDVEQESLMAVCTEQLSPHYQKYTTFSMVRRRHFVDGVRVQVAAHVDRDTSLFATFWVANEDLRPPPGQGDGEMVAASELPPPR